MSGWGAGPADAGTVQIRVQVVDVEPAALDMIVPTYITAGDLSRRIAIDGNLGAFWPDGTRRLFWIRARGRILVEQEKLDDLGVVNGELIHILPQPPANSGVIERVPAIAPRPKGTGKSIFRMIRGFLLLFVFAGLLALALSAEANWYVSMVPGLALGLLATSASRHFFGPPGSSIRIPLVGLGLLILLLPMCFIPVFVWGEDIVHTLLMLVLAFATGFLGVVLGWLGWYGAVEPLADHRLEQMVQQVQEVLEAPCGLCSRAVELTDAEIRLDCQYGCGQVFHSGCYRARMAVSPPDQCAACGYRPQAG
jgi:hypothetical protein